MVAIYSWLLFSLGQCVFVSVDLSAYLDEVNCEPVQISIHCV